jgi:cyclopropane fatty-acyl-phospholipid synthase-like methyltransferase
VSEPPTQSPKQVVAAGYNAIADTYTAWAGTVRVAERHKYTCVLLDRLPEGAMVLELGCGAGMPTTQLLAERFAVTGVDISAEQLERARVNVPGGTFIQSDMMALAFPPATFDAVTAFYAITHVPREEHVTLFGDVRKWLNPGGLFVASLSSGGSVGEIEDDWLGAPTYFSGYDRETNLQLLADAGFTIEQATDETDEEFGRPTTFLWVVARAPAPGKEL